MSARNQRIVAAARKVADALKAESRLFDAQQIENLIRSTNRLHVHNQSIFRENQDLRNGK